jgi:hypothetical protein
LYAHIGMRQVEIESDGSCQMTIVTLVT